MNDVLAFDGDDTLWHNETIFSLTHRQFVELLQRHVSDVPVGERLLATEIRNLGIFGYGIKGFVLSMLETAIEVTEGRIPASDLGLLIDLGKAMLGHPVELLDGVRETLTALAPHYRLMLITKGDLFDQESKIARSTLADLFWRVEIVSEKDPETYRHILTAHDIDLGRFMMVGNSLRSDILPVLELGARAVHIPYHETWAAETVDTPMAPQEGFYELESIRGLPQLLARLSAIGDIGQPA